MDAIFKKIQHRLKADLCIAIKHYNKKPEVLKGYQAQRKLVT